MQPILDHLDNIVRPAIREYFAAEQELDAANARGDAQAVADARFEVIRKARTAAVELNHLTDFVLHNQVPPMAFRPHRYPYSDPIGLRLRPRHYGGRRHRSAARRC